MDETEPFVGSPKDVRRWAADRAAANVVEVRELVEHWGEPERSVEAAFALLDLWAAIHGWPPPEDPIDRREDLVVWDRFARLRRPYVQ